MIMGYGTVRTESRDKFRHYKRIMVSFSIIITVAIIITIYCLKSVLKLPFS